MALPLTVFSEPWEVNKRLTELGLDEMALVESAQAGFAARAACTENHPPAFRGFVAWGETVRTLRDKLTPTKWRRLNESNLALVVDEAGSIAISVATGTEETGRLDGLPQTSSAKGIKTAGAVQVNIQGILFPEWARELEESLATGRATWILLIYCDKETREVRCELSRPVSMTEDGYINGWYERIILKSTPFDAPDDIRLPEDGGGSPQSPEIVVEIKRRA